MPLLIFIYFLIVMSLIGFTLGFIIFWKLVIKPYLKIKKAIRKKEKEKWVR